MEAPLSFPPLLRSAAAMAALGSHARATRAGTCRCQLCQLPPARLPLAQLPLPPAFRAFGSTTAGLHASRLPESFPSPRTLVNIRGCQRDALQAAERVLCERGTLLALSSAEWPI